MNAHPDKASANTQDLPRLPRLRRRRCWRHLALWAGLVVFTLGSYVGTYQWWFKPAIRADVTRAVDLHLSVYYFFFPIAWLDYRLAERRTHHYMEGLWRISARYDLNGKALTQERVGWLWIDWTTEKSASGSDVVRCVVIPSDRPSQVHDLYNFTPYAIEYNRNGIEEELASHLMGSLSRTAPGYVFSVVLKPSLEIPENALIERTHLTWRLYPVPQGRPRFSPPARQNCNSTRDRLEALFDGPGSLDQTAKEHPPNPFGDPAKFGDFTEFTRVSDNDSGRSIIMKEVNRILHDQATQQEEAEKPGN